MMPTVFRIPLINRDIPGYGLMMMIGFLTAIWWGVRRARKSQADPDVILNCGFIALLGGVVGARIMYVMAHWEHFAWRGNTLDFLWRLVNVSQGGLEFYGGFLFAAGGIVLYLWRAGHSLRWYLDIMAPSGALGLAFGRIGCFLNGCCWGGVCDLPWAVRFPHGSSPQAMHWQDMRAGADLPEELVPVDGPTGIINRIPREDLAASDAEIAEAERREQELRKQFSEATAALAAAPAGTPQAAKAQAEHDKLEYKLSRAKVQFTAIRRQMERYNMSAAQIRSLAAQYPSLPVHPTQIYSAINAFFIALLLNALYYRRRFDGQVICLLFIIQPVTRFLIETIRDDVPPNIFGLFTRSQFLALLMGVGATACLLYLRTQPVRSPRARIFVPEQEEKGEPAASAR